MTPIVRNNFIYRKVWNNTQRLDKGAVFVTVGDVGSGKSTGMIRVAEDLDETFNIDRICFSVSDFMKVLNEGDRNGKLKPGSAIILDESAGSEEGVDSRDSLTQTNKIISYFSTITRAKRYIIIYVAPFLEQLDKRIKKIGVTGIFCFLGVNSKEKRSKVSFYWNIVNPMAGYVINPKPRVLDEKDRLVMYDQLTIPLPSKELLVEYKEKKNNFIGKKIDDWSKKLIQDEEKKKWNEKIDLKQFVDIVMENPKDYLTRTGKVDKVKILLDFGLTERNSRVVKAGVEQELWRRENNETAVKQTN